MKTLVKLIRIQRLSTRTLEDISRMTDEEMLRDLVLRVLLKIKDVIEEPVSLGGHRNTPRPSLELAPDVPTVADYIRKEMAVQNWSQDQLLARMEGYYDFNRQELTTILLQSHHPWFALSSLFRARLAAAGVLIPDHVGTEA